MRVKKINSVMDLIYKTKGEGNECKEKIMVDIIKLKSSFWAWVEFYKLQKLNKRNIIYKKGGNKQTKKKVEHYKENGRYIQWYKS
jgi:hypothetical protein